MNNLKKSEVELDERLHKAKEGFAELDIKFQDIDRQIHNVRTDFYDYFRPPIKFLPALDLDVNHPNEDNSAEVSHAMMVPCQAALPPISTLNRPELKVGQTIFAMKYSLFARWVQATVCSVIRREPHNSLYEVRYMRSLAVTTSRQLNGKQLAYDTPCPTRLTVGTRIIARYRDEDTSKYGSIQGNFYVGIVAEVPTSANKFKYLVFFDDGYAQYVVHKDIRVVTEASIFPWEDVSSDARDFIKEYIQMYPERPMVRLQKWNNVKTEWNGKWWRAQVMDVEGSLVKMYFPTDGRTEWIYRGSTRLSPLFHKKMSQQATAEQQITRVTARRRTAFTRQSGPVVEYNTFGQAEALADGSSGSVPTPVMKALLESPVKVDPMAGSPYTPGHSPIVHPMPHPTTPVQQPSNRSVAKKSSAARPGTPPPELLEKIQQEKTGYIRKAQIPPLNRKFKVHQCGPLCVGGARGEELLKKNRNISPLLIPIVLGWRRQIVKIRKKAQTRKSIFYATPCCRRVRTVDELFMYLRTTKSMLEVDFFSFDLNIDVINEWAPHKEFYVKTDLSDGVEPMPISVVNSLDTSPPLPLVYSKHRKPGVGVPLDLDPAYLVCCSCTDDCQDKSRCECWQLTNESNSRMPSGLQLNEPGYTNRRLYEQVNRIILKFFKESNRTEI